MARRASLLAALMLLGACASEATTTAPAGDTPTSEATSTSAPEACVAPADQKDVAYVAGGDPLQRLDLYLPPAAGCVAPLDTEGFSVAAAVAGGGPLAELYRSVFGTDETRWAELSPLSHVAEAPIPDLFLVTRGTAARREQVTTFADAVGAADGVVTIVDLPTFTHEDVNKRIGDPTDDKLTPALVEFLTGCLAG